MAKTRSTHSEPDYVDVGLAYARDVLGGKIPACRYVKLACQRHLDDLKRWDSEDSPYWFDRRAANAKCRFVELLPHTKGIWAAKQQKIKLEPWQCFVETVRFGWKRRNGTRRFRKSYEEVPRKNGKSIRKAATGLYMLAADGEFGAEVYSGATTEKQAWEVFRPARLMVIRTPDLKEAFSVEVNASNLSIIENGSRFEPLIGKPGDGASPSYVVHDEFHEHETTDQADAMETGMGAREQPLQDFITTAGVNLSGPCYQMRREVIDVLEGRIENDELFGIIYTIDEGDDWADPASLVKANPNYGVSVSADFLLQRQREAKQSARKQNAFRTKHLNQWVGAKTAWMNMISWGQCPARKSLDELAGRPVFVGLDLASKIDIAALVMLFPPHGDDLWHLHGKYYLPESMLEPGASVNSSHYDTWAKQGLLTVTDGEIIDFDEIMDDIRDLSPRFDVQEIAYDQYQATHLVTTMLKEGAPMVQYGATVKNFSDPMKQIEAFVKTKVLAHGDCPVMTWMMSNVVAALDAKDNIFPRKETVDAKIDGPVAAIMAMGRALVTTEDSSVYETRGIRTL